LRPHYLISIAVILCLGVVVYSNTFSCSFHFDDFQSIPSNPFIRDLHKLHNIWVFWPCRFITYLSLALNYHFNGLHVWGYHLVNLAIHLIAAVLVGWLVLLTLSTPAMKGDKIAGHANTIALFAAMVFVAHPLQTEAVTYIVQRAASLAALFYLASLCLYIRSRLHEDSRPYYIGSLLAAMLAMFTKEIAITLPLMIMFYEFCFLRTKKSMGWRPIAPFFLISFIIPLTTVLTRSVNIQGLNRLYEAPPGISPIHYFLTQLRVMMTYIRLMFVPLNQNMDYDYPVYRHLFEAPVLAGAISLMAILWGAKQLFAKYRLVSFSILWVFITLLPESSFFPIKDLIVEHRLYLPLAGYSIFLASGAYYLTDGKAFKTAAIVLTMIIACYAFLAFQRNKIWENELTLWNDALQKSPGKVRPYNNRGTAYFVLGQYAKAISDYNKALALNPRFEEALANRGLVYYRQGKIAQAFSEYDKAIAINPNYPEAYYNRAYAYEKQGKFDQAVRDYNETLALNPLDAAAYYNRANIYYQWGDYVQAISDYNKAIKLYPEDADYRSNLGLAWGQLHRILAARPQPKPR